MLDVLYVVAHCLCLWGYLLDLSVQLDDQLFEATEFVLDGLEAVDDHVHVA